ncbi:MAG TPA: nitroreductase family protein [Thermoproteota archaeon]|nr:nitroreductase family protein [Thermoproteota archaeon]
METKEAVKRRRSVRSYRPKKVPTDVIETLVEASCKAPSAGDVHPYRIVVVRKGPKRKGLAKASRGQGFVARAPVSLVFFVDLGLARRRYGERGAKLYSLLDVGAAVENLMISAVDMGLGTCWVGAFDERAVGELLDAPPQWRAVSIITLGWPLGKDKHTPPPLLTEMLRSEGCRTRWSR